ncbi:type II toxin-antitoxin system PemK/MazF family toxin [Coraliomargarita algicola]|uniref:Type II toxin-antitoxin system PemK/MazF family toxin n=1 Tax=Coraliomargarita algicola TaxID=3092156 RepID=A0ABZ0RMN7_9BACT|nr:type II toxin-antitoxin system PemK/MazF family toxin [Coraliomargarita sp. J2-16]WPJ94204.1 type II toxin-antitoxin system PemK/MazF family toxin [Coraliomargarita sp. J2-16]
MDVKRGDVVTCVIAGDYGKPRPALVLQSNLYNRTHASVVVLPITSHCIDAPLFRISLSPGKGNGLKLPSQIMVDKLSALRRDRLGQRIGHVSPAVLARVESALVGFLDLPAS